MNKKVPHDLYTKDMVNQSLNDFIDTMFLEEKLVAEDGVQKTLTRKQLFEFCTTDLVFSSQYLPLYISCVIKTSTFNGFNRFCSAFCVPMSWEY